MFLGYNTNGLAHHDPVQAVELLAEIGYRGVALTLDHHLLNPFRSDLLVHIEAMRECLAKHDMQSVIETGARFLLDPHRKHEPTLICSDERGRQRRVDFLCRAVDIADELDSSCVSLWSGVVEQGVDRETAFSRLVQELEKVLTYAAGKSMTIAFEPEPGMLVATMEDFGELLQRIDAPNLALTLDVGHLHCLGETPIRDVICRWRNRIANVHIEDMRRGTHEHLMFGEGEMDFRPIVQAFAEIGYGGGLYVELSRHSHEGPTAAHRAFDFLSPLLRCHPM